MPATWLPLLAFTVGAALVVAGVAAIYWPAGLIVAGLCPIVLFVDFGSFGSRDDGR
jgi:hypothetical protein